MELRRKGLEDDVIQSTLDENVDENALALEAARKYARKIQHLEWPDFRQKLAGFLGRRGFSYGVIAPILRQVWSEVSKLPGDDQYIFDDEDLI